MQHEALQSAGMAASLTLSYLAGAHWSECLAKPMHVARCGLPCALLLLNLLCALPAMLPNNGCRTE